MKQTEFLVKEGLLPTPIPKGPAAIYATILGNNQHS